MSRPGHKSGKGSSADAERKRHQTSPAPASHRRTKLGYLATFAIGAGISAAVAFAITSRAQPDLQSGPAPAQSAPTSHYDLLAMTPEQLAEVDVAVMNLLCAKGLPGAENLDIPAALAKLDEYAAKVKFETERHLYRVTDPKYAEHYNHSEARLRAEFIVQCLQEDCGVHYNMDRVRNVDFSRPQDLFIHGMANSDNGGTCSSMPVLYAAIGRRLGYPIKLVVAKQHVFCRWDDGKERFNIDGATNGGVNYHTDDYYRTWPHPISDAEMASGEFLKSLEPKEELAVFLLQRACCFQAHRRMEDTRACLAEGLQLMPNSPTLQGALMSTFSRRPQIRMAQRLPQDPEAYLPPEVRATMPPRPVDPDDPTPRITMPGVNPTFGIPNNRPMAGINQEVPR